MLAGPIRRMPWPRANSTSSRSAAAPSGPASAKPVAMTTTPRTRLAAHWRTTSATSAAGTVMTARWTSSGMSVTAANAGTLATWGVVGFTG